MSAIYCAKESMRVTVADIDCSALRWNIQQVRQRAGARAIMAMVKANAYGHGIVECSQIFRSEGAEFLGVAFADEAVLLRAEGDSLPLAVLTPPLPEEAALFCQHGLDFVACSLDTMQAFNREARAAKTTLNAHLYIDTGMRRDGVEPHDAIAFVQACSSLENIRIVGVCTHFATSDEANPTFALHQLALFQQTLDALAGAGYTFPLVHAANSGAVLNIPQAAFTLVRPGLTLYGYNPSEQLHTHLPLRPAMALRTKIHSVRRVPAGTSISYGRRYYTKRETHIATIPIGYGDGLTRLLTGRATCLLRGEEFPIVGSICMDQCMIDTGDTAAQPGEEVVLIGTQGTATLSANAIARKLGTIPYEVLTAISARVPRIYSNRNGGSPHV